MLENGKNDVILKKSYEISYALWRISANIPEKGLSGKLAEKAIELIGLGAADDIDGITAKLPGIEIIIKFGVDVNYISVANGEILAKEIGNLKSAIFDLNAANSFDGLITPAGDYDIDISDIFSPKAIEEELPETLIDLSSYEFEIQNKEKLKAAGKISNENGGSNGSGNTSIKAEARQAAILERIRQIGNCRLSDIQVILPDCSERTIRYDLESLVQRNVVERVGTGGRSVYYRIPPQSSGQ